MPEDKTRVIDLKKIPECGGAFGTPLVHNGSVYFGAFDTYFYSLDARTGKKKWTYKTNGAMISTPAIKKDTIYFGCFDEHLYALSTDGRFLWKFRTGGLIASTPAIYENAVYFSSADYNIYAVDLNTQQELWRFRTGDEIIGDPVVHNNRIYFGSMDSYFYCLDLNGNLVWKYKTGDAIALGKPAISDGMIYFASSDNVLYALTLDGGLVWKFYSGGIMYNYIFVYGNTIFSGNRERHLYALDKKTGICKWKFMSALFMPRAFVFNDLVFVAAEKIYCLNINGFKIWEYSSGLNDVEGIAVNEDGVYFCCGLDAKVCKISHYGQLIWEFRTNGAILPITAFKKAVPPPKWNSDLMDEDIKPARTLNAYTILKERDSIKKYMETGIDTTGRYAEIGSSEMYRKLGMESAGAYGLKESGKKKKDLLEELIGQQRKERPFGG